jgi:hypothetical protein
VEITVFDAQMGDWDKVINMYVLGFAGTAALVTFGARVNKLLSVPLRPSFILFGTAASLVVGAMTSLRA